MIEIGACQVGHPRFAKEEIARLGKERYQQEIAPNVGEADFGKAVLVDIETGEYEIGTDALELADRLRTKHADAAIFAMRVGYPAFAKIGGGWKVRSDQ